MTESPFPFDADVEEVVAERNNRRLVAAGAGIAALALLGFFVILPALSGGEGEDEDVIPVRRPAAAAPAPASPVPSPKPTTLTETFTDTVGRDPFRPLFAPPAAGGGGTVVVGAPTTGGGGAPAPAPGTGGGTGTGGTSGGSAQVGGNRVSLIDVFVRDGETFAQTRVGGTVYTPQVGQGFATNYQLLSASGECATYLYGDESFQLCEGQEVLK